MAARGSARGRIELVVGGERFQFAKPFLCMHSPWWRQRLAEEPGLAEVELQGEADDFRAFSDFLQGAEGAAGEVTASNVVPLLYWAKEFDIEYISSQCEMFLIRDWRDGLPVGLDYIQLVQIAARHNMPTLYERAIEAAGHNMEGVDEAALEAILASDDIRDDLVDAQREIGDARTFLQGKNKLRMADHAHLNDVEQRAAILWKSRLHRPAPYQGATFDGPRLAPY